MWCRSPDQDQRDRPSTQVWSARGGDVKSRHYAKNYPNLKPLLQNELLEYYAGTGCTTKLALHFSLVNANATDGLVKEGKHLTTGYDGVRLFVDKRIIHQNQCLRRHVADAAGPVQPAPDGDRIP